jgi:hypothetical protein
VGKKMVKDGKSGITENYPHIPFCGKTQQEEWNKP